MARKTSSSAALTALALVAIVLAACNKDSGPRPEVVRASLLHVVQPWALDTLGSPSADECDSGAAAVGSSWAKQQYVGAIREYALASATEKAAGALVEGLLPGSWVVKEAGSSLVDKVTGVALEFDAASSLWQAGSHSVRVADLGSGALGAIDPVRAEQLLSHLPGETSFTNEILLTYDQANREVWLLMTGDCGGPSSPVARPEVRAWEARYRVDSNGIPVGDPTLTRVSLTPGRRPISTPDPARLSLTLQEGDLGFREELQRDGIPVGGLCVFELGGFDLSDLPSGADGLGEFVTSPSHAWWAYSDEVRDHLMLVLPPRGLPGRHSIVFSPPGHASVRATCDVVPEGSTLPFRLRHTGVEVSTFPDSRGGLLYLFEVDGFDLRTLPSEVVPGMLTGSAGVGLIYVNQPPRAPYIAALLDPKAPAGTYEVSLSVPGGSRVSGSFQHPR